MPTAGLRRFSRSGTSPASTGSLQARRYLAEASYRGRPTGQGLTGVNGEEAIPTEYQLLPNYPNPFNLSTVIRFGVPELSHVRLEVYSIFGSLVATILDEEIQAGVYDRQWFADQFPSGAYVVRISARSLVSSKRFNSSRRLMLIK